MTPEQQQQLALEADNKRLRGALKKRLTTIEKFRQHMQSMCTVCKQNAENVKNGIIGAVYCGRHNQSTEEMMIREALSAPPPSVSGILRLAKYALALEVLEAAGTYSENLWGKLKNAIGKSAKALTLEERAMLEEVEL